MRRLYTLLLLLGSCVGAMAQASFQHRASSGQLLSYRVLADSCTVELTHPQSEWPYYGADKPVGRLVVPARVNYEGRTYAVVGIGENALYRCDGLTELLLPEGCRWIGTQALNGCTSLRSCSLPSTLTEVGEGAMAYCNSLSELDLPTSVRWVGLSAFAECSGLQRVRIPAALWNARNALLFHGCGWIEKVKNGEMQPDGRIFLQR